MDVTVICTRGIFAFEVKNYNAPYIWINREGHIVKYYSPYHQYTQSNKNYIKKQTKNHKRAIRGQIRKYNKLRNNRTKFFNILNSIYSPLAYVNPNNHYDYNKDYSRLLGIDVVNMQNCVEYINQHPSIMKKTDVNKIYNYLKGISDITEEQRRPYYYLSGNYIHVLKNLEDYEINIMKLLRITASAERPLNIAIQQEQKYNHMWPGVQAAYYQLKHIL